MDFLSCRLQVSILRDMLLTPDSKMYIRQASSETRTCLGAGLSFVVNFKVIFKFVSTHSRLCILI